MSEADALLWPESWLDFFVKNGRFEAGDWPFPETYTDAADRQLAMLVLWDKGAGLFPRAAAAGDGDAPGTGAHEAAAAGGASGWEAEGDRENKGGGRELGPEAEVDKTGAGAARDSGGRAGSDGSSTTDRGGDNSSTTGSDGDTGGAAGAETPADLPAEDPCPPRWAELWEELVRGSREAALPEACLLARRYRLAIPAERMPALAKRALRDPEMAVLLWPLWGERGRRFLSATAAYGELLLDAPGLWRRGKTKARLAFLLWQHRRDAEAAAELLAGEREGGAFFTKAKALLTRDRRRHPGEEGLRAFDEAARRMLTAGPGLEQREDYEALVSEGPPYWSAAHARAFGAAVHKALQEDRRIFHDKKKRRYERLLDIAAYAVDPKLAGWFDGELAAYAGAYGGSEAVSAFLDTLSFRNKMWKICQSASSRR